MATKLNEHEKVFVYYGVVNIIMGNLKLGQNTKHLILTIVTS